ncbi:Pimeloyl-ACP methyl ester carboxylesterase [Poseidonocella pacifica]|uniref:Pimeloyl-ACP methyl ester carboxylesterase n=1 Tax=Poseidonocella pacifica TaxID=871651 RepID=A0A1I0VN28_9RHOB|nr:alpha/beta fold hydrolase [Poseidonocella pacifica]SFA77899.1 Pimeloyl-ACP methyl ester carboxylesterase [Poseidonocella pacifica]
MLNTIRHGQATDLPPLVILHGLFGSARNWGVIAKRLSDQREVIAVDLRNHGQSPWRDTHSYPEMAEDLAETLPDGPVDLIGHSMGGKAAMVFALQHPDRVNRLLVADIAPVSYSHSQMQFVDAMRAVDLSKVERRSDAAAQLGDLGVEPALQSFFTQSLDVKARRWLLNLDVLAAEMPKVLGFPEIKAQFERPALFLSGGMSDYVRPEHRETIRALFPAARFAKLPKAGHWLHAEEPRAFEKSVRVFMG